MRESIPFCKIEMFPLKSCFSSLLLLLIVLVSIRIDYINANCIHYKGFYCSSDCRTLYKCLDRREFKILTCSDSTSCNMIERNCSQVYMSPGTCARPVDQNQRQDYDDDYGNKYYMRRDRYGNQYQERIFESELNCTHYEPMPHPTDCTKYVICPEGKRMSCPTGLSFNLETKLCDQDMQSANCQKGVTKTCTHDILGHAEALTGNENVFSLCTKHMVKYQFESTPC